MEQKEITAAKPKAKKEVSGMRKITSELDSEVQKIESNKIKIAKLEKAISTGNDRIKSLMSQLAKNFS